jgi:hypothetical protein
VSEFLSEEEFDRRYLVKQTVARTLLRRAAETDDPRAAAKLANDARVALERLPRDKAKCRAAWCRHCRGQSWSQELTPIYEFGITKRILPGRMVCTRCGASSTEIEVVFRWPKAYGFAQ